MKINKLILELNDVDMDVVNTAIAQGTSIDGPTLALVGDIFLSNLKI